VSEDKGIHFGKWVQWARLKKGFSRDEFAHRIGVTTRQLAKIEAEPEPASYERTLLAIAQGLGIATDEMIDRWRVEPVGLSPPRRPKGKRADSRDESAAARLLAGEPVMLDELKAHAKIRGVGLGQLFRDITREWLAEHRPEFAGIHTNFGAHRIRLANFDGSGACLDRAGVNRARGGENKSRRRGEQRKSHDSD